MEAQATSPPSSSPSDLKGETTETRPFRSNTYTLKSGLSFGTLEAGDLSHPLVLFVHGFPDTAYTWEDVLAPVASAGFHAVAFFQRGYYPTDIPPAPADYGAARLGMDVLEMIAACGHKAAHAVVGHDWGALATYSAASLDEESEIVQRVVAIAIPPPRALQPGLGFLWTGRHFIYLATPFAASGTRADNFKYLDTLYHRWSPTWKIPTHELSRIKADFLQPGRVEAAIGYYKAIVSRSDADKNVGRKKIRAPLLVFGGLDDGVSDRASFLRAPLQCVDPSKCKVELVPQAGHWPHREQPEIFLKNLLEFLQDK